MSTVWEARAPAYRELLSKGMTLTEIAASLNISVATVCRDLQACRAKGIVPQQRRRMDSYKIEVLAGAPAGFIGLEFRALDPEIQEWVASQIPTGVSLAGFAMSCVVDAYHEEKES